MLQARRRHSVPTVLMPRPFWAFLGLIAFAAVSPFFGGVALSAYLFYKIGQLFVGHQKDQGR